MASPTRINCKSWPKLGKTCDRLFGLKGEEVSVERDAWDEVRLRALCAHHGWEFSWMTEDDERRRRIAKGCGN